MPVVPERRVPSASCSYAEADDGESSAGNSQPEERVRPRRQILKRIAPVLSRARYYTEPDYRRAVDSSMGKMRDPVSGQWYWYREFDEDEELQPHEQLWMNFVEMTPEDSGDMALEDIPVHSDEVDEASSDSERIGSASTTTPDDEASGSWPGATLPVVPDEAEVENRDDDEEASVEGSTDLEESSSGIA